MTTQQQGQPGHWPEPGQPDPAVLLKRIAGLEKTLADVAELGLSHDGEPAPAGLSAEVARIGVDAWKLRQGRQWADARIAEQGWQAPAATADLTGELALPRQSYAYRIPGLAGWNHNVLLAGPRKTGKSQLAVNLSAALSLSSAWTAQHGQWASAPFLGLSQCFMSGNVAYINAEMDADDWRDTFRALPGSSYDGHRIFPLHCRGTPLPVFTSPAARAWFITWLRERHIEVLIGDTWGALCAKNGVRKFNDDGEVRPILDGLDEIKQEAGVASAVMLIHMPHQVPGMRHLERFKGAGAVGDWADVLWSYVEDEEGIRYLSAHGRARIDQDESSLYFDPGTGLLSWGMTGSRSQTAASRAETRVTEVLRKAGEDGMLTEDLLDAAGGHRADIRKLVKKMASNGELEIRPSKKDGARAKRYFLPGLSDQSYGGTAGG